MNLLIFIIRKQKKGKKRKRGGGGMFCVKRTSQRGEKEGERKNKGVGEEKNRQKNPLLLSVQKKRGRGEVQLLYSC